MVTLTESAVQKMRELSAGRDGTYGLRVQLLPGGSCGTHYHFLLDRPRQGDLVMGLPGALLVVEPAVYALLRGARLDYGARLKPPRFRVLRNPNTPERCPCGRSFGSPYPGKNTPQCRAYQPMVWDADGR